jgi:hypothetical protein
LNGVVTRLVRRLALGALLIVSTLAAAGPRPHARAPAVAHGPPLLWRIEKNGKTSYLFGTAHVGLDLDATLQPAGRDALDGSKHLFVELDLSTFWSVVEVARQLRARAELPPQYSLHELLGPVAWTRLTALTKGRFEPDRLDRLEPWFVVFASLPAVGKPTHAPGVAATRPPLDSAIVLRARARGIQVTPLETSLQQIEVFAGLDRREAVKMLRELLRHPESERDETAGLLGAYVTDDERRLAKVFGRLWRRKPALAERLLFDRNQAMCDRLVLWLPDGGAFVAVGAFHMLGDRGLVALLRRRGYVVERVQAPAIERASTSSVVAPGLAGALLRQ